jgi:hypothetical protein
MNTASKYYALLQTVSTLTTQQRELAESKYLELLELALGGSSGVRGAYCEYVAVRSLRAENPWDPVTLSELQAIKIWEEASLEAARMVFRQVKVADNDAYFELHVWNSRTR